MTFLSNLNEQTARFVRNKGVYKIADIVEKVTLSTIGRKTALITGAGIAGLAAAFELHEKGFHVVIAEKRSDFARFNVINFNKEVQEFLKKFNLLEEFEASVAARIHDHQI